MKMFPRPNDDFECVVPPIPLLVYQEAIQQYGKESQIDVAIEEMAELTQALLHERRGRSANIAEEIADVRIMLRQLELIFSCTEEVETLRQKKITRLAGRIHKDRLETKNPEARSESTPEDVE